MVSIIVPIYNVQDYLERCVYSIVNQTYSDLEIILVDDGSKDNCSKICDKWASKDHRIVVIHKQNGGLSDARNAGLRIAKGQYVMFVDSDDDIPCDAVSNFLEVSGSDDPDIIVGNYRYINNRDARNIEHKVIKSDFIYSGNDYLKLVIATKEYVIPVWTNLYRLEYLKSNSFYFEKGLLHEDERWTPFVFMKAAVIKYTPCIVYNYYLRSNSISIKKDYSENIKNLIVVLKNNTSDFSCIVKDKELLKLLYKDVVEKYLYYSWRFKMNRAQRRQYIDVVFLKSNYVTFTNRFKIFLFQYCHPFLMLYFNIVKFLR